MTEPAAQEPGDPGPSDPIDPAAPAGNRTVQLLALAVFAALVVVVGLILVSGRAPKTDPYARGSADGTAGPAGLEQTRSLLDGLQQRGVTLGDPNAPATIIEFIDFQCPFCREHQLEQQPAVIRDLVRTGKAQLAVQPLAFLGPDSFTTRNVYLRLAARNHAWEFLNLAFWNQGPENSGYATDQWLRAITADIPGITNTDLARGMDPVVRRGIDEAERLKRTLMKPGDGTPYIVVGRTADDPARYRKVDLGAEGTAAKSIAAAVDALR